MSTPAMPEVGAIHQAFISTAVSRLRQQESRILDCIERLSEEQIWHRANENSNSVGNLVLHLIGNLGQWVLTGLGGAPDLRKRDLEFSTREGVSKAELAERLQRCMRSVTEVIEKIPAYRLLEHVTPQGYDLPVMEVITHITEHFYHHGGQIILLTKLYLDVDLQYYRDLRMDNKAHSYRIP